VSQATGSCQQAAAGPDVSMALRTQAPIIQPAACREARTRSEACTMRSAARSGPGGCAPWTGRGAGDGATDAGQRRPVRVGDQDPATVPRGGSGLAADVERQRLRPAALRVLAR